jgi:hypothetical protein
MGDASGMDDEAVDADAVTADVEAIEWVVEAFDEVCDDVDRVVVAVMERSGWDGWHPHCRAVRERLAGLEVPIDRGTADDLLVAAAEARAALQRVLALGAGTAVVHHGALDVEDDARPDDEELDDELGDEDLADELDAEADDTEADEVEDDEVEDDEVEDPEGAEEELTARDAARGPEASAPAGYRLATVLPTRPWSSVLVLSDDGGWVRAAITRDVSGVLWVQFRRTGRRRLSELEPHRIALPHARP